MTSRCFILITVSLLFFTACGHDYQPVEEPKDDYSPPEVDGRLKPAATENNEKVDEKDGECIGSNQTAIVELEPEPEPEPEITEPELEAENIEQTEDNSAIYIYPVKPVYNIATKINLPPMSLNSPGAPWLLGMELGGWLVKDDIEYTETAAGGEGAACLKILKVVTDVAGTSGTLHEEIERCVKADNNYYVTYSPDTIKMQMNGFAYADPCFGKVEITGSAECKGWMTEYKGSGKKWSNSYACKAFNVVFKVGNNEYNVTSNITKTANGHGAETDKEQIAAGYVTIDGAKTQFSNNGMPDDVSACWKY